MAKKARRARLWAEGITVLVLVFGVTMAAIVRIGSDNAPATSDAPTFVPGNTEYRSTLKGVRFLISATRLRLTH